MASEPVRCVCEQPQQLTLIQGGQVHQRRSRSVRDHNRQIDHRLAYLLSTGLDHLQSCLARSKLGRSPDDVRVAELLQAHHGIYGRRG